MGALSGAIAQAAIYPLEVVQTRLAATHGVYNGIVDVIRSLWQKEGGRAFYRYDCSCFMRYAGIVIGSFECCGGQGWGMSCLGASFPSRYFHLHPTLACSAGYFQAVIW